MAGRLGIGAVLFLVVIVPACQSLSPTSQAQRDGNALLEKRDYAGAASSFERAAALSTDPEAKARAYIGAGRTYLEKDDPREALKFLYEARQTYHAGETALETNRALGQAYFVLSDYALARRYLTKGLGSADYEGRDLDVARLAICSRALGDVASAAAYRSRLSQPISADVRRILSTVPTRRVDEDDAEMDRDAVPEQVWVPPAKRSTDPSQTPRKPGDNRLFVLSRDQWGAHAAKRNVELMGRIGKLTIHHTGGEDFWGNTREAAAAEIRKIQKYHQGDQGWADIGYHYVIDREGDIWQGRRLRYQGAHARGSANQGNVGVVLLGNFCHQSPSAAQARSLEALVVKLCDYFAIPPDRVYTHREISGGKTNCPGPALTSFVREFRSALARQLVAYRR